MDYAVLKMNKKLLMEMLKQQDFRCALSGRELSPDTASIDHIMPLSRGGKHCPTNAQIIDLDVNQAKRNMTNDEFIEMCCDVADKCRADIQAMDELDLHEHRTAN
jgi:hypothetical protein